MFHFVSVNRCRWTTAQLLLQPHSGHRDTFVHQFSPCSTQLSHSRFSVHCPHLSRRTQLWGCFSVWPQFPSAVWHPSSRKCNKWDVFPGKTVSVANLIFFLRGNLVASQKFWISSCLQELKKMWIWFHWRKTIQKFSFHLGVFCRGERNLFSRGKKAKQAHFLPNTPIKPVTRQVGPSSDWHWWRLRGVGWGHVSPQGGSRGCPSVRV